MVSDTGYVQQRLLNEAHQRYRKEQELLLGAIHSLGMHTARDPFGRSSRQQGRVLPMSWLGQQRQNVSLTSQRLGRVSWSKLLVYSLVLCSIDDKLWEVSM